MSPHSLKRVFIFITALALSLIMANSGHSQSRFDGWSSVVVAADWRDSEGAPIDAFENARRDLSASFKKAGLPADLHQSLTLNPARDDASSPAEALRKIEDALTKASKGCLLYVTSHGSPGSLVFGNGRELSPLDLAIMLRRWCDTKPTVLVLSACYSGSFVDALRAPNRMIVTAARRDRSSFGCGEGETYPWFDACILESLPQSSDFLDLTRLSRACVSRRESDAGIETPSEPQIFVGSDMHFRLPTLRFEKGH